MCLDKYGDKYGISKNITLNDFDTPFNIESKDDIETLRKNIENYNEDICNTGIYASTDDTKSNKQLSIQFFSDKNNISVNIQCTNNSYVTELGAKILTGREANVFIWDD